MLRPQYSFIAYFTFSLIIAVISFFAGPNFFGIQLDDILLTITDDYIPRPGTNHIRSGLDHYVILILHYQYLTYVLAIIWFVMLLASVHLFKKKWGWILIGLPFASWPFLFVFLIWLACATGGGCL